MTTKAKPKKNSNAHKIKAQEKKIERLELLSRAQDLEHMTTKIQALQVKLQQLQTEATMASRQLTEIQNEGQEMAKVYYAELDAYKKKYSVPADKEVNLRTGELVDPQPQQPGAAPVPQEGSSPVESTPDEASQS